MTQYLVPLGDDDPVNQAGRYLALRADWWWGGRNDGVMVGVNITNALTAIGGLIAMGYTIWGTPTQNVDWWIIILSLIWSLPPQGLGFALQRYAMRRALAIPSGHQSDYGGPTFPHIIADGRRAYDAMEPILREGARPVYDKMYASLARYHIANEDEALAAASKRGQLLKDIAAEGRLTRAMQIDIADESDLSFGRQIVDEMKLSRRELT